MKLDYALRISNELIERLKPTCERIEIAGSIRRERPDVHDIELVVIPDLAPLPMPSLEFGKPIPKVFSTSLDHVLFEMSEERMIRFEKNGKKYKKFDIAWHLPSSTALPSAISVDLFLVTPPAQWGVQCVIRTGPNKTDNNFSQWCVTWRSKGGGLPDDYFIEGGAVCYTHKEGTLPMPEEIDFLNLLGLGWVEPKDRVARWKR